MLKVKDNVDFKELEKFGYNETINFDGNHIFVKKIFYDRYIGDCSFIVICGRYINLEKKTNSGLKFIANDKDCEKFILDLIQAGLVEKIKGE